jgi:putative transposase
LNCHLFVNVLEAQQILENWRYDDNQYRPHSPLDYLTPAEFVAQLDAGEQRVVTNQVAIPVPGLNECCELCTASER